MHIQTKPTVIVHNFRNLKSSPMFEQSLQIAVIGAGMAGLLIARELKREGHRVIVFEKSNRLGGTWVYDPRVETDPLGLD